MGLTIVAIITNIFLLVLNCADLIESDQEEDRCIAFVLVLVSVTNIVAIVVNRVN